jgi:recombination protein RecR
MDISSFPPSLRRLIEEFSKLPSIGEKSATRLAYHIVAQRPELASALSDALTQAVSSVSFCSKCFFLSEEEECKICKNSSRDESILCVVEKPMDVMAIERVGDFSGHYHVLHGVWAPLRGEGPEKMKLGELLKRVNEGVVKEIILATSSTVEGDATALYIHKLLSEQGLKVSRLAQGMPKGGELEYADELTLSRALMGRTSL